MLGTTPHPEVARLADTVLAGRALDREDLLALAEFSRSRPYEVLHGAYRIRTAIFGRQVRVCSIFPGKLGGCTEDCKWCAQTHRRMRARRTPLGQVVQAAAQAGRVGAAGFGIVNAGRRPTPADLRHVLDAVSAIRARAGAAPGALCASLGELTPAQARQLAAAGVRRYNHNLETSERFFPSVVGTHSYADRLATLQAARRARMELCCGGLFGMGETWADRVDLALALRNRIRPQVVPLNFLHPIPGTALQHARPLEPLEILSIIAVFRHALPTLDLKVAGGRQVNLRDLQSWAFHAGATSCIVGGYLTTPGRDAAEDLRMLADLGLRVVRTLRPRRVPKAAPTRPRPR